MRICLVTPELPPYVAGGIGTYVLTLARGYAARGHDVTVAGFRIHPDPRLVHDWGESLSLETSLSLDWLANQWPLLWRLGRLRLAASILQGALAVRDFVKANAGSFDIVEVANYLGHGAFLPAGLCRYVIRLSTPGVDCGMPKTSYSTWFERRSCHRADLVIAHSEAMKEKGRERYDLDVNKAVVIPLGLSDVLMSSSNPGRDDLRLIYVGRAEHRKGTDLLIRALAMVMSRRPELHLTVVGGDFDAYSAGSTELEVLWSGLRSRHSDRIELLGRVGEVVKERAIARSHWLIVPSRFESFGLVAAEAMRAGTPVIGTDGGGLAEVCGECPDNMVCKAGDFEDLCRALNAACEAGPERAMMLRASARAAYERRFSDDRMIEHSLSEYEALVRRGAGRRFRIVSPADAALGIQGN